MERSLVLHHTYLNSKEEKELSDHLILAARSGFGKTRRDVMNLVERYMLKQQPSKSVNLSNGWWYNFKKRNPNLSLRSGDSTSTVRMNAVNPENVNTYFDLLEDLLIFIATLKPSIIWMKQACP